MKKSSSPVTTFVVGGALVMLACLAVVGVSMDIAATAAQQDTPNPLQPNVRQVDLRFSHLSQQTVAGNFYRSKVPGGWLVVSESSNRQQSMVFLPDPEHKWDGKSLP